MNTAVKLGVYVSGLVVVFGGALGVGALAGPPAVETPRTSHEISDQTAGHGHGAEAQPASGQEGSGHEMSGHEESGEAAEVPGGLQVSERGITLVPETTTLTPGQETDFRFTVGAYGHLVALAGDLAYLHVHPETTKTAGPEITFHTEVPSPGGYRRFLDFQHGGTVRTADFTVQAH